MNLIELFSTLRTHKITPEKAQICLIIEKLGGCATAKEIASALGYADTKSVNLGRMIYYGLVISKDADIAGSNIGRPIKTYSLTEEGKEINRLIQTAISCNN